MVSNKSKPSEPNPDGRLPRAVLHHLGEHTVGGFAIFYFNPETGFPQHVLSFDSPAHCLAMQKHMTDWCNALQAVYMEGTKAAIRETFNDNSQE
jgi:hypothetical protein